MKTYFSSATWSLFVAVYAALVTSLHATSYQVTFDEYSSGRVVNSEYSTNGQDNTNSPLPAGIGFRVSVSSVARGDDATGNANIYNTAPPRGEDDDLEYGNRAREESSDHHA